MNARILLVDDETALIRSLQPVLIAQGYGVDSAGTAAEALKKAKETVFDIILLDLGLPDADGKERPDALGADETAWALNRRAVTVTVQ
jgi:two-component system KDP operon response regulator KdpE